MTIVWMDKRVPAMFPLSYGTVRNDSSIVLVCYDQHRTTKYKTVQCYDESINRMNWNDDGVVSWFFSSRRYLLLKNFNNGRVPTYEG